jgi:hypothetical protein
MSTPRVFFSKEEVESYFTLQQQKLNQEYQLKSQKLINDKKMALENIYVARQPTEPFDEICLTSTKTGKIIKVQVPKTNYENITIDDKDRKGDLKYHLKSCYDMVKKLMEQARSLHNLPRHPRAMYEDEDVEENDMCLCFTLKLPEGDFWIDDNGRWYNFNSDEKWMPDSSPNFVKTLNNRVEIYQHITLNLGISPYSDDEDGDDEDEDDDEDD